MVPSARKFSVFSHVRFSGYLLGRCGLNLTNLISEMVGAFSIIECFGQLVARCIQRLLVYDWNPLPHYWCSWPMATTGFLLSPGTISWCLFRSSLSLSTTAMKYCFNFLRTKPFYSRGNFKWWSPFLVTVIVWWGIVLGRRLERERHQYWSGLTYSISNTLKILYCTICDWWHGLCDNCVYCSFLVFIRNLLCCVNMRDNAHRSPFIEVWSIVIRGWSVILTIW